MQFYDKLLIATGTTPFKPKIAGIDFDNVFALRTNLDQSAIKEKAKGAKKIAIIGGGFIGSEVASSLKMEFKENVEINLISADNGIMTKVFGQEIGQLLVSEHEKAGVKVHQNKKAVEIKGSNNTASTVVLNDGTEIEADLVIVGAGVLPATKFLDGSGIDVDQWGGVLVDPFLQTSVNDVYAAGDIASYPYWVTGKRQRVEHYITSMNQGSNAAFNMLGKMVPFGDIPFYWTRNYNKSIQYVGYAPEYDEIHVQGDIKAGKFLAFYIKSGKVLAVSGQNNGGALLTYMEALA